MPLQHDNAITHTSDATSAVIASDIEYVSQPHYSLELVSSDFWLFAAVQQHSKEFISYVMKYQQLQGYGFKKCLKSSATTCWKILFFASVALY